MERSALAFFSFYECTRNNSMVFGSFFENLGLCFGGLMSRGTRCRYAPTPRDTPSSAKVPLSWK